MFGSTKNFIKKLLEDKIEWKEQRGILYGRPKSDDTFFHEIFVITKPIGFFEYKYIFTALYHALDSSEMDKNGVKAFRYLKGMECDLIVKGFLRKHFFFDFRKDLYQLSEMVEGLKLNPTLIENLNKNEELLSKIRKLGAIELNVRLKSISELYAPFIKGRDTLLQAEKAYYENPEELIWTVTLSMILSQGPSLRRNIKFIYDVLNIISKHIEEVTENVLRKSDLDR